MKYQNKPDFTHNQARQLKFCFRYFAPFAVAIMILFTFGCATTPPSAGTAQVPGDQAGRPMQAAVDTQHAGAEVTNAEKPEGGDSKTLITMGSEPASELTFPTFKNTGAEICTNKEGLPLIYMFSSSRCPHCEWGGGGYDFIVRFFTAEGQIEAHHYDLLSGDDLLTEEIETEIPADKLEIYKHGNPQDLVPYYNFGCAYDRIGNGYEKENDLVAEGEEMRRVIEALVHIISEKKQN